MQADALCGAAMCIAACFVFCFAVVLDAKDEAAITFYEHFGFQGFVDRKDRLFLPMATIKKEIDNQQ